VLCASTLVLAACGDDGSGTGSDANAAGKSAAGAPTELKVGVIAPFTVKAAFVGPNVRSGAELAAAQIKEAGGPAVKLLVEDDQGALDQSINALEKLSEVDDADMIVGPTSLTIISMLDRIKRDGVTHLIAVGSTSGLDEEMAGSNIYRVVGSDSLAGPAMAQVAIDAGFESCGSLFEDQESAQSVKENVDAAFEGLGGKISAESDLAVGQPSYRSEAFNLLDGDPGCVFFQIEPENAASFFSSAAEFKDQLANTTFVSTDVAVAPEMLEAMKPAIDAGAKLIAVAPAPAGEGMEQFVAAFEEANGAKPEVFADTAFDAVTMYALASVAAGTTEPEAVQKALVDISREGQSCIAYADCAEMLKAGTDIDYQGASGDVDFDDQHNVIGPFGVFEIVGGEQKQTRLVDEAELESILARLE